MYLILSRLLPFIESIHISIHEWVWEILFILFLNADDFEELVESLNPINYLAFFTLEDEDGCNEIEQLLEGLFAYLIYVMR